MDCNLTLVEEKHDIILVVEYFTELVEAMSTIKSNGETTTHFILNHIMSYFGVFKGLITDHGRHFQNKMMYDLPLKLGYKKIILFCFLPSSELIG